MGRAQRNAIGYMQYLNTETTRTRAAMCVRDRSNNVWMWHVDGDYFSDDDSRHVEEKLVDHLKEIYPDGLPKYAIIVIYIDKKSL